MDLVTAAGFVSTLLAAMLAIAAMGWAGRDSDLHWLTLNVALAGLFFSTVSATSPQGLSLMWLLVAIAFTIIVRTFADMRRHRV